jgi:hypothetical protein
LSYNQSSQQAAFTTTKSSNPQLPKFDAPYILAHSSALSPSPYPSVLSPHFHPLTFVALNALLIGDGGG